MSWQGLIKEFSEHLPITANTPPLTLLEGNTPLIKAENISKELDLNIYFKYEGLNPTGSFKDRGMVMAVAKALEAGSKAILCASTGNTAASAAAYAARAGIKCYVLLPSGHVAKGKLAQALLYGATALAVDGNFDEALDIARSLTSKHPITLVNSVNPYRIEGQKTGSFEICNQLGKAPDFLCIPVGNAGNITAYWRGFKEYFDLGKVDSKPKMMGFQAAGSAPIVLGHKVEHPETVATAIRIGNPASWQFAIDAANESQGQINMVSDEEILSAYRMLASREGVFVEPASAASLAGLIKYRDNFPSRSTVVCILTGNGLKDPETAFTTAPSELRSVQATEEAVLGAIS
jgi:threonine synthase